MGFKDYEILIANILRGIAKLEGIANSRVRHNVQMTGLSGASHQIDVYWEFDIGPMTYKTVVQAKGGNKKVDLPTFMTFKGVLDDLKGRPRGMMVTRSGYDKGNIDTVASAYDIAMFIVDEIPGIEITAVGESLSITLKSFRFSQAYDTVALNKVLKDFEIDNTTFTGKNTGRPILADAVKDWVIEAAILADATTSKDGKLFACKPKEPLLLPVGKGYSLTVIELFSEIQRKEISRRQQVLLSQYLVQSATGDKRYVVDNSFRVKKLKYT